MLIYIIGSVQQEEDIKKLAGYLDTEFLKDKGINIIHVKKEPEKSLSTLITDCFNTIAKADLILAVKKSDDSFGSGVLYEICFCNFIGKQVMEISVDDIRKLEDDTERAEFLIKVATMVLPEEGK